MAANRDDSLIRARSAVAAGDFAGAERLVRAKLATDPNNSAAVLMLGQLQLRANRVDEALASFDLAAEITPSDAPPFTLKATVAFRRHFGDPIAPRTQPPDAGAAVSMRALGSKGRFGNQLLQYGFLRLYARRHGLAIEAPDWIGRDLYDLDDPLITHAFPSADEDSEDLFASLNGRSETVYANRDLDGYFCRHTSQWGERRDEFRALFKPGRKVESALQDALRRVEARGRTIVAIHLRRGDFGYGRYWIAPVEWYRSWLDEIWPSLEAPVLYVASDDPGAAAAFRRFAPLDLKAIGVDLPGAEFYVDHHILSKAHHLAISNSTFSFTAAMLNETARSFVRPHPDRRSLVAFDPWNAEVTLDPTFRPDAVAVDDRALITQFIQPLDLVVHVGTICSDWTNFARATHFQLKVVELTPGTTVDAARKEQKLRHIQHLVIERADDFDRTIRGSEETLRSARINAVHFRRDAADKGPDLAALRRLGAFGYAIFQSTGGGLLPMAPKDVKTPGSYLAVQERLLPALTRKPVSGLDLPALVRQHRIRMRGVIHVGAHEAQELPVYEQLGAKRVLLIEANPAVYERLRKATAGRKHVTVVNRAICDHRGKVDLHVASFDQSSSLLPLHRHLEVYPDVLPAGTISVDGVTLDELVAELDVPYSAFNVLSVDVQGAEALVLKGAAKTLQHIEAIIIEVNFTDLYRGAAEIDDIEAILRAAGFTRAALVSAFTATWGDAFYVRA